MITITIENIENNELKYELKKIINNDELLIENILNTINKEENYNKLLFTLKSLSERSNTIKKLCQRLEKNPPNFKTKVMQYLKISKNECYWHFSQIKNCSMN